MILAKRAGIVERVTADEIIIDTGAEGTRSSDEPLAIASPTRTSGCWLMQVFWFERVYLVSL